MAKDRFNGCPPGIPSPDAGLHVLFPWACQVHRCVGDLFPRSPITPIAIAVQWLPAGGPLDLFECVTVKGIIMGASMAKIQFLMEYGHLAAEFIPFVGFAFGDAFHHRRVNAVHFVGVVPGLAEDPLFKGQKFCMTLIGSLAFAPDVPDDPAQEIRSLRVCFRALLSWRAWVYRPCLMKASLPEAFAILPKIDTPLFGNSHQGASGLVVKPGIRGKGHHFLLNRRIHVHMLDITKGQPFAPFVRKINQ